MWAGLEGEEAGHLHLRQCLGLKLLHGHAPVYEGLEHIFAHDRLLSKAFSHAISGKPAHLSAPQPHLSPLHAPNPFGLGQHRTYPITLPNPLLSVDFGKNGFNSGNLRILVNSVYAPNNMIAGRNSCKLAM